jgi:hypothetical protein
MVEGSAARPVGSAKNSFKPWAENISARKSRLRCAQTQIAPYFYNEAAAKFTDQGIAFRADKPFRRSMK